MESLSPEIVKKLQTFKGLILDADGVWFSGHEYRAVLDGKLIALKRRHYHDGQGLSFLRSLPIKVVFATGENEPLPSLINKMNDELSCKNGTWAEVEYFTNELKKGGKVESLETWLEKHHLNWSECAYIGDDSTDYDAMKMAGLKIAPSNGTRLIKKIADIILTRSGGEGCVREFSEIVLDARNIDETELPFT